MLAADCEISDYEKSFKRLVSSGKLLSKRWWIPIGARLEGTKFEPEWPRAEVGVRPPTRGFRAFKALCLAFMAFK